MDDNVLENLIKKWQEEGVYKRPVREEKKYCPQCNKVLYARTGPYGEFLGCSGYPKCHYTEPIK